jgi:hypothetical protein
LNDVWALDLSTGEWTEVSPIGASPEPRRFFPHAYDSLRNRLIVAGGEGDDLAIFLDTWALDLGDGEPVWTRLRDENPPPFFIFRGGLYDPRRDRFVVMTFSTQTYALDLGTNEWTTLLTTDPPPDTLRFTTHSVTYDALNDRYLIFGGGIGSDLTTYTNRVRALDPETLAWTVIEIPPEMPQPSPRNLAGTVYDPVPPSLLLFGGAEPGGFGGGVSLGDTWRLDLTPGAEVWTDLAPGLAPLDRGQNAVAFDEGRGEMLVFGGLHYFDDFVSFAALNDTWIFDDAAWRRIGRGGPRPLPRRGAGAVHDPTRDRLVVFGGEFFPGFQESLTGELDFHPSTLNLKSQGKWVTCHITPPGGFTAGDIDPATVRLNENVAPDGPMAIEDSGGDGVGRLMLKFRRSEVIATIRSVSASTEMAITGEVAGETFEASDRIRVLWVGDRDVALGTELDFAVTLPTPKLTRGRVTYLISGAPPGAEFDRSVGRFRWTPAQSDAETERLVSFAALGPGFGLKETITIRVTGTVPAELTTLLAD